MARHGGRRRGGHDDHPDHPDERWVLTYADLITLLMALFMVLFSISSVNKSKYETLQRTLSEAFSGKVTSGGSSILASGSDDTVKKASIDTSTPLTQPTATGANAAKARAEDRGLKELQRRVEAIARAKGLGGKVQVRLNDSGLVIRVMTDDLLFHSGQATPEPQSLDLLSRIGHILAAERSHSVLVEGYTDPVPVAGQYPTNWELSTARASSIVRSFQTAGVAKARLTASGRADLNPIAPNTTAAGRKINRRVEILLPRQTVAPATTSSTTPEP
jgi:chemotaxis protein MotB